MLKLGCIIDGKYKIIRTLGRGSFGCVYLAYNISSGKKWAVKELITDKETYMYLELLKNEINALKNLKHSNLSSIGDVIKAEDSFFILTDYIEGVNLKALMNEYAKKDNGHLPASLVHSIFKDICSALCYLGSLDPPIIHRDIKPSNIILTKDKEAVLIDFGAAASMGVDQAVVTGNMIYAPPENYKCKTYASYDIYSLGATMYHLLTGNQPDDSIFNDEKKNNNFKGKFEDEFYDGLIQIIRKCMEKDESLQYSTPHELMNDLNDPASLSLHKRKRVRKENTLGVLLMVLMLVFGGLSVIGGHMENKYKSSAYKYCLMEAKASYGTEAAQMYRTAIMLFPNLEDGYLGLIETLTKDNELTDSDDKMIQDALGFCEYNRAVTNEEMLKTNKGGYLKVMYKLGMAYFYCYNDLYDVKARKYLKVLSDLDPYYYSLEGPKLGDEIYMWSDRASSIEWIIKCHEAVRSFDDEFKVRTVTDYWSAIRNLISSRCCYRTGEIEDYWILGDAASYIYLNANELIKNDISMDDIKEQLELVEMEKELLELEAEEEQYKEILEYIGQMIELCKEQIKVYDKYDKAVKALEAYDEAV